MGVTINDLKTFYDIFNLNHGETTVFFKFGADWCIPCTELDKILVTIPNSVIYYISVDNVNFESYLIENHIYTIPNTIIKYGEKTKKAIGITTVTQIEKYIEELKKNN